MIVYLDTSAAGKLLIEEAESSTLARHLDDVNADDSNMIASSFLLETELRRLVGRAGIEQRRATDLLARFALIDVDRGAFREAGLVLPHRNIRSLDALHIVAASRIAADQFITYDLRQRDAAVELGLTVVQPGA